jgi:hypothetical protein
MDSLLPKSKVCNKCGEEKLLEEFYKHKNRKHDRNSKCKVCCKQYEKARYAANKERNIERKIKETKYLTENDLLPKTKTCSKCGFRKLLGEFNKNKIGKYGRMSRCKLCEKKYYQENKEKKKQYRQNNKERTAEYGKKYRQENKERKNEWRRNRRKNDEQYRIRHCLSRNLLHTLNVIGKTKNASILTYIGCSIEFMKEHLNSTKKPNWGDDLHIDHIIPSSLFDHTNEEEIKKCWNWRNLRYLPAEENTRKGNTLDMDLVKSYGIEDLLPVGVDK